MFSDSYQFRFFFRFVILSEGLGRGFVSDSSSLTFYDNSRTDRPAGRQASEQTDERTYVRTSNANHQKEYFSPPGAERVTETLVVYKMARDDSRNQCEPSAYSRYGVPDLTSFH